MRLAAAMVVLSLAAAGPAFGQFEYRPDDSYPWQRKKRAQKQEPAPLAQALSLAFGATVWADVNISTSGPVADMSVLVRQGFYKLELIELILMSEQARKPLKEAVEKRRKGKKLSEIARDYQLDYDKLYESALAVEELVDREYLPRFPERRPRKETDEP